MSEIAIGAAGLALAIATFAISIMPKIARTHPAEWRVAVSVFGWAGRKVYPYCIGLGFGVYIGEDWPEALPYALVFMLAGILLSGFGWVLQQVDAYVQNGKSGR